MPEFATRLSSSAFRRNPFNRGKSLLRHLAAWLALLWAACALAQPAAPVLLVLGDSLSAEYGLQRGAGWVGLLADRLKSTTPQWNGPQYSVVNASISGETTSGGRTRLVALLKQHRPAVVVIQLGGNDGLRGLPLAAMKENLRAMIRAARETQASVLLVGMQMPPNYGRDYAEGFAAVYGQLAREEKVGLAPFLLDGFAERLEFFQSDRIHPSAEAQPRMLANVWPHLRPLLARSGRG
jgi:acyl-CoA thioesterase-1